MEVVISIVVGLLAGVCSSAFLHSLSWITEIRQSHHYLIWGLPLFGFIFGHFIKRIPHHINQGMPYILSEIENPKAHVSPWMAPFIFFASLGTHLFGGSVGREGVGVVMGASIAHVIPRFKLAYQDIRKYLIYSGIAAGFSSIFATPLAGIIFAFELHAFKDVRNFKLITTTIASSLSAFFFQRFFGPEAHEHFAVSFNLDFSLLIYILISAVTSGIGGLLFYWGHKEYTKLISKYVPQVEWKLFTGGLLITLIVFLTNGYDYIGIGTEVFTKSFENQLSIYDFFMKCLLTIMTISIGFKGGEVTPLFFMGATFSNSVLSFFNFKNYGLSSALGMLAIFGAVTSTPIASCALAFELFGTKVGIIAIPACLLARLLMRNKSVYRH